MSRLRNTNLGVFTQCQHTRTILRNKNIGLRLFKKYSKVQNFDEILTVARPDSEARIWMFLYNATKQEPL